MEKFVSHLFTSALRAREQRLIWETKGAPAEQGPPPAETPKQSATTPDQTARQEVGGIGSWLQRGQEYLNSVAKEARAKAREQVVAKLPESTQALVKGVLDAKDAKDFGQKVEALAKDTGSENSVAALAALINEAMVDSGKTDLRVTVKNPIYATMNGDLVAGGLVVEASSGGATKGGAVLGANNRAYRTEAEARASWEAVRNAPKPGPDTPIDASWRIDGGKILRNLTGNQLALIGEAEKAGVKFRDLNTDGAKTTKATVIDFKDKEGKPQSEVVATPFNDDLLHNRDIVDTLEKKVTPRLAPKPVEKPDEALQAQIDNVVKQVKEAVSLKVPVSLKVVAIQGMLAGLNAVKTLVDQKKVADMLNAEIKKDESMKDYEVGVKDGKLAIYKKDEKPVQEPATEEKPTEVKEEKKADKIDVKNDGKTLEITVTPPDATAKVEDPKGNKTIYKGNKEGKIVINITMNGPYLVSNPGTQTQRVEVTTNVQQQQQQQNAPGTTPEKPQNAIEQLKKFADAFVKIVLGICQQFGITPRELLTGRPGKNKEDLNIPTPTLKDRRNEIAKEADRAEREGTDKSGKKLDPAAKKEYVARLREDVKKLDVQIKESERNDKIYDEGVDRLNRQAQEGRRHGVPLRVRPQPGKRTVVVQYEGGTGPTDMDKYKMFVNTVTNSLPRNTAVASGRDLVINYTNVNGNVAVAVDNRDQRVYSSVEQHTNVNQNTISASNSNVNVASANERSAAGAAQAVAPNPRARVENTPVAPAPAPIVPPPAPPPAPAKPKPTIKIPSKPTGSLD